MRLPSLAGFAVLLLAAAGVYRSRDLAWGGADLADGTRYKVSPGGISHVLEPTHSVSPTRNCRWGEPASANGLCAGAADAVLALAGLRLVEPLVYLGTGLAAAAALVVLVGKNHRPRARAWLIGAALVACLTAPALLGYTAPRAIESLGSLQFGVGGTLGTLLIAFAAAVLGGFTLALARRSGHPVGVAGMLLVLGLVLPALAFIEMFPLPQGYGFLLPGLGAGFAAGTWSSREQFPESVSR